MSGPDLHLRVHTSPFLRQGVSTPRLMWDVHLAVLPVVVVAVWQFGLSAVLVIAAATAGAAFTEWLFAGARRRTTLADGSALLTGVLLGLTLPPGFPLWMAFIGGVAGIGLGKAVWGGLGNNLFNPALVGRAFLQAAFPTTITTWHPPAGFWDLRPSNLAVPFQQVQVDAATAATALNRMKFEHEAMPTADLFLGTVPGSLGETSALVILAAGAWMAARRVLDWRIPASILVTVFALAGGLYLLDPTAFATPWFMLFSGSLLFGAVYMATDPASSPLTPRGSVLYGVGIGALVVLIRTWGGLPEGVMYAILLMNASVPLIERIGQPRVYGHARRKTS